MLKLAKKALILVVLTAVTMSAGSCAYFRQYLDDTTELTPPESSTNNIKYGVAVHQQAYSEIIPAKYTWELFEKLKSENKNFGPILESRLPDEEINDPIDKLLEKKCEMIVLTGKEYKEIAIQYAKDNPDIKFVCLEADYTGTTIPSNLIGIYLKVEEGVYIVGYIAARINEMGFLGYIGSTNNRLEDAYIFNAYKAGAVKGKASVTVYEQYVSNLDNSEECAALAAKMYNNETGNRVSNIFYNLPLSVGEGGPRAAQNIGKLSSTFDPSPQFIGRSRLTAGVSRRYDTILDPIVSNFFKSEEFEGGTTIIGDLGNEGVTVGGSNGALVSLDIQKEAETIKGQIISGEIKMPK